MLPLLLRWPAAMEYGRLHLLLLLAYYLSPMPLQAAAAGLSFEYDFSVSGVLERAKLLYVNDSFPNGDRISLTKMSNESAGRVAYAQPVHLWDCLSGKAASFVTSFSFVIGDHLTDQRGDGIAFFVGSFPPILPPRSTAQYLGLYTAPDISGSPPLVAVEFDTFWNDHLDPPNVSNHIGIDINSVHSTNYTSLQNLGLYGTMSANITYDAGTQMLLVTVRLADGSDHSVQTPVDFRAAGVPNDAAVGFSASTGAYWELHQILSWSFNSTDIGDATPTGPSCKKTEPWLKPVMYSEGSLLILIVVIFVIVYCRCRRRQARRRRPLELRMPVPMEFSYDELKEATADFANGRLLGAGCFGKVYRGKLQDPSKPQQVAVKRLTVDVNTLEPRQLQQTMRNYLAEINTLGPLYHRNLVKLIGWCDAGGKGLLLVYELMTNKSVDKYLHEPAERLLTWPERYEIMLGVGYAIEYLHTCFPSAILHRDIKPSNVMLDKDFTPKLGDFGLVRQLLPGQGYLSGTAMAGDNDYIDPVCRSDHTASTASDMYSFGVLLLEIATGKKPANGLIDAVKDSYARGAVLEMADQQLNGAFERWEMERVLAVGLLCVKPDRKDRPKIRDAVYLLSSEALPAAVADVFQSMNSRSNNVE